MDWRDRLNSFGAQSIPLVASLAHEFNLLDLVPDLEHKILTSGFGDEGADYAPLAYGPGLASAYLPEQREITVNTTVFVDTVKAKWRNPVNGLETQIGHLLHGDRVFLIPPAPGDWVLILEANSQPDHAIP